MFNYQIHQGSRERDKLARDVAERSVTATLDRLGECASRLSPAELRGYVRAHAMPIVREEAIQLVGRELPKSDMNALILAALEQATHLVVRQMKAHPVVAMPAPHIRLRIAA